MDENKVFYAKRFKYLEIAILIIGFFGWCGSTRSQNIAEDELKAVESAQVKLEKISDANVEAHRSMEKQLTRIETKLEELLDTPSSPSAKASGYQLRNNWVQIIGRDFRDTDVKGNALVEASQVLPSSNSRRRQCMELGEQAKQLYSAYYSAQKSYNDLFNEQAGFTALNPSASEPLLKKIKPPQDAMVRLLKELVPQLRTVTGAINDNVKPLKEELERRHTDAAATASKYKTFSNWLTAIAYILAVLIAVGIMRTETSAPKQDA